MLTTKVLKSPYVYFGGKSKASALIWDRFGDVDNFVDPFMGSLAVLLGRPVNHKRRAETVNDLDKYICNFWRALKADPVGVAKYADWPVNETDLTARHLWLVNQGQERLMPLQGDPDYYDAKVAGWWVWGINAWIGSGWCSGTGNWNVDETGNLIDQNVAIDRIGVKRQRPHLCDRGKGINRKRPHLGTRGQGINRLEHNDLDDLIGYMQALADRLRGVRVCSGDWQRVVTNGALAYGETVGIFLDPPYDVSTGRDMRLYTHESDVSTAVREWAIEHGDNPRYKICLAGYEGEHVMPESWSKIAWLANASYKSSAGDQNGNRKLERLWFSPHCLNQQPELFSL
jgi:hypothetical protein